jgi:hypothetical protein
VAPRWRLLALGPSGPERCPQFHPGQAPNLPGHCSAVVETDDGYELAYTWLPLTSRPSFSRTIETLKDADGPSA